jgi:hypothetical protein
MSIEVRLLYVAATCFAIAAVIRIAMILSEFSVMSELGRHAVESGIIP